MSREYIPTQEELNDKLWRLTHLYYITDKSGNEILFNLNWAQKELFNKEWYQMLVLKARQLGVTTYFSINFLDDCFWHANMHSGIIAHRKEDAESIFKSKVKYAYDRMPEWTRTFNSATNDRSGELAFENGSSYRVSTGFRSGTYQRLLISEFGKICAKSPDVAKEIVTGSLNTVSSDQIVAIESTAEGREGYFYEFSKTAEALSKIGYPLSQMQQRFFFFPWFDEPGYREPGTGIIVSKETNEYLDSIELERKRKIDEEQRRWYEMKSKMLGDSMKQEYPSTPREAFESANEGLYYGQQLAKIRATNGVCRVPYDDSLPVHTAWDIGLDDFSSIWCFQVNRGGNISIINYYENWDEGAAHYCDWLNKQKYRFGRHIFPHDARKRDIGAKTQYIDYVTPLLDGKIIILDIKECDKLEGIQTVRSMLSRCVFDEEKTSKGLRHLEAYKKVWDDRLGCYKNTPLHDEHSHACVTGSTLICTDKGEVKMEEILVGDVVKTPTGFRKVLNKFQYIVKDLVEIKTSKNKSLLCTGNHKVFTDKHLDYADTLMYNDVIINNEQDGYEICQKYIGCLGEKINLGFRDIFLLMNQKQKFYLMENPIVGMDSISKVALDYIEMFGSTIMEKFQKITTPIILMVTQKTMIYQTYNACINSTIFHLMPKEINGSEAMEIKNSFEKLMIRQKNGMLVKRVRNGIQKMERKHGLFENGLQSFVKYVTRKLKLLIQVEKQCVPEIVKPNKEILKASITNKDFVKYVTQDSSLTNTERKEHVVSIVPLNYLNARYVYDIEVEHDHCYYANGILVSNSDAFRYLAIGLKAIEKRDGRGADEDIKAVNRYYGL
jgi:intein/homing endonuclease